jgi:hypothetical protein
VVCSERIASGEKLIHPGEKTGRIEFKLYDDIAPKVCGLSLFYARPALIH